MWTSIRRTSRSLLVDPAPTGRSPPVRRYVKSRRRSPWVHHWNSRFPVLETGRCCQRTTPQWGFEIGVGLEALGKYHSRQTIDQSHALDIILVQRFISRVAPFVRSSGGIINDDLIMSASDHFVLETCSGSADRCDLVKGATRVCRKG